MQQSQLAPLLAGPITLSNRTTEEIREHFGQKYELAPYHGRDVYLFSANRAFGDSKHIVAIHERNSGAVPEHIYQYVLITYCYAGSFVMGVDGAQVTLAAGDCIVCDRNVPHSVAETDDATFAVNIILRDRFFTRRMLADISRLGAAFPTELATNGAPHTNYRVYRTAGDELVRTCIDRILCEHFDTQMGSADIIDDFTAAMLTHLFRTFEADSTQMHEYDRRAALIGEVREYVGTHYREGNLSQMAGDLGYESTYLSSVIRKATGQTFKQLVNAERMRHAITLLQGSSMPISDVAVAVGVSNLTQFYKRFREYADCTPQEYRKKVGGR